LEAKAVSCFIGAAAGICERVSLAVYQPSLLI
jgi:hypothetical protein